MKRIFLIVNIIIMLLSLCGCNPSNSSLTNGHQATVTNNNVNTSTAIPNERIFTIATEDSRTIIQVVTTRENYLYNITEIDIISDGRSINTINNVVGYYGDISLDNQNSFALINYCGKKWTNFLLIDIVSGQVLYYEPFDFQDIRSAYQENGDKMDYEINENDIIVFLCEKVLDKNSIIIDYQVHDNNGHIQSGKFEYNLSNHSFGSMQQNSPFPEG